MNWHLRLWKWHYMTFSVVVADLLMSWKYLQVSSNLQEVIQYRLESFQIAGILYGNVYRALRKTIAVVSQLVSSGTQFQWLYSE